MSAASSGVYDGVGAQATGGLASISFTALYREHAAFTWAVLRRLGVQPAAIDDAMQELWVTAHRRLATLHGPATARAWLYGIARRVVSHQRRTEHRHRRKVDAFEHAAPEPERPDLAGALVVESILAGLDDRVREAFVLSELEGWTAAEIAKATGANANTVSWRVRVAKQELRERFADDTQAGAAVIHLRERTKASKRATQHCWLSIGPLVEAAAGSAATATTAVSWGALKVAAIAATITVGAALGLEAARPPAPAQPPSSIAAVVAEAEPDAAHRVASPSAPAAVLPEAAVIPPAPAIDVGTPRRVTGDRVADRGSVPPPPAAPATAVDARDDGMDPEDVAMLSRAQQAVRTGRFDEADAELREHRRRFPSSRLGDLRELVEVSLLCRTGHREDARRRIDAAIARAGTESQRAKLDAACRE